MVSRHSQSARYVYSILLLASIFPHTVLKTLTSAPAKGIGALASLAGVALIALGDLSGSSDSHRGTFPHKTSTEIAAGDVLALLSAALYGIYTTRFKQRVGDESRVDMLLFLGSVGVLNAVCLWPGFLVLDWTGWETLEWPTEGKVQEILLVSLGLESTYARMVREN